MILQVLLTVLIILLVTAVSLLLGTWAYDWLLRLIISGAERGMVLLAATVLAVATVAILFRTINLLTTLPRPGEDEDDDDEDGPEPEQIVYIPKDFPLGPRPRPRPKKKK